MWRGGKTCHVVFLFEESKNAVLCISLSGYKTIAFLFPFGRRFSDPEFELLAEVCQVSKAYLLGYF